MVSNQERVRRYTALRTMMDSEGYQALIFAGQAEPTQRGYLRYVSDWRLWGGKGFVVLPLTGDPVLILGAGSQPHVAKTVGWIEDIRAAGNMLDELTQTITALGLARGVIGVAGMGNAMLYDDVTRLMRQLPQARLLDATGPVDAIMAIRSAEEMQAALDTSRRIAQAHATLRNTLRVGMTERQWMATATHTLAELGCLDGIAHLTNGVQPYFHPPTERTLRAEDHLKVSLEFAGPTGYWIELPGVYSFQEPPARLRRYFESSLAALQNVRTMLKPGVTGGDVTRTIEATYRQAGWTITGRGLWDGHLIGLNVIHPPYGQGDSTDVFQAGMLFNVHPGLLVDDDHLGMFFMDNLIVTPDGGKRLDEAYQYEWHVV